MIIIRIINATTAIIIQRLPVFVFDGTTGSVVVSNSVSVSDSVVVLDYFVVVFEVSVV
jgi:hypothetical protein